MTYNLEGIAFYGYRKHVFYAERPAAFTVTYEFKPVAEKFQPTITDGFPYIMGAHNSCITGINTLCAFFRKPYLFAF